MKTNTIKSMDNLKKVLGLQLIIAISLIMVSFTPAPTTASAVETVTVKGTITDASTKKAINGATVQVMGTDIKVVTKKNGSYKITFQNSATKLLVSCPGYTSLEVAIGGRSEVNVAISLKYAEPDLWN